MSRIKSKNTKPEILIRKLLHNIGYRYRIHIKNITGKPDLTFTRRKKVIFVHGCFWHRHKNCKFSTCPKTNIEFWNEKFEKNIKRDRKVQLELNKQGWKHLVIWECELKHLEKIKTKILNFLGPTSSSKKIDLFNEVSSSY